MTRPLAAAYAASFSRVLSWVVVFGLVHRTAGDRGDANVAILALARSTVGLLSYLSLGLTPVLVRMLTRDGSTAEQKHRDYSTAGVLIAALACVGAVALYAVIRWAVPGLSAGLLSTREGAMVFAAVGSGTLLRTASDWPASALLAGARITTDSLLQAAAEVTFVALAAIHWSHQPAITAATAYGVAGASLFVFRLIAATAVLKPKWAAVDRRMFLPIALLGGGVVLGQLADWLYAPWNQLLIKHYLIQPPLVAAYALVIQIDGGLLLAVGGLSAVLLPTAAIMFGDGRIAHLRRQYVRGMIASFFLLTGGAIFVCGFSELLFQIWLHDSMPVARAILPLVMIHTVIGGTATIGRAVLLGIGRIKAYTISALIGGVANAMLATIIVTHTSLGLRGVVLATVITVTVRCGLWMPWYTLRCLRPQPGSSI